MFFFTKSRQKNELLAGPGEEVPRVEGATPPRLEALRGAETHRGPEEVACDHRQGRRSWKEVSLTTETPESAKATPEKGQRFGLLLVKSLFTTETQSNPEVWFRVRKQLSLASKTDGNRVGQDRLAKEQASSEQLGPHTV